MKKRSIITLIIVLVLSFMILPTFAANDFEVDLAAKGGEERPAHGYGDTKTLLLGYGGKVDLGSIDLSQYERIEVTYATDMGFKAKTATMTRNSGFGIKSAADPHYGAVTGFNDEKSLGFADAEDAYVTNEDGANWDKGERVAVIDIKDVTHNGNVYLMTFNSEGNEFLIAGIKFFAKTAATEPETNVPTGDISLITLAMVSAFSTMALKKKRR